MFRPETDGYRYKGFYTNPNPFGLYMAVMIGVFLCEIDYYIKCKDCLLYTSDYEFIKKSTMRSIIKQTKEIDLP